MFYVDRYAGKVVKEKDKFAAPERYYKYKKGVSDDIIIETYVKSFSPLQLIDFAYPIKSNILSDGRREVDVQRDNLFKENNMSMNPTLYAYTVPSKWYEEEIAKFKDKTIYAICVTLDAGYQSDQKRIKESGINVGDKIELEDARVGGWNTDVYLVGYDGSFNSVFFDFVDEDGNEYDIYSDENYKAYW